MGIVTSARAKRGTMWLKSLACGAACKMEAVLPHLPQAGPANRWTVMRPSTFPPHSQLAADLPHPRGGDLTAPRNQERALEVFGLWDSTCA